jgi:hypothetical protein
MQEKKIQKEERREQRIDERELIEDNLKNASMSCPVTIYIMLFFFHAFLNRALFWVSLFPSPN